jgi:uncharacterized protein (TIGR04222 family)
MGQPWGLSGPQFLLVYGAGVAVIVVAAAVLRFLVRWVPGPRTDRQLDAPAAGYLAGGPMRAAQVVIAGLLDAGALRVDSAGRVTVADQLAFAQQSGFLTGGLPAQDFAGWRGAIMTRLGPGGMPATPFPELWMPSGTSVYQLQQKISRMPGIAAIGTRLRADRLIVSRSRARVIAVTVLLLWAALFVTGGLRLAEGAHNHRPINDLQGLVIVSGVVCLFTMAGLLRSLTHTRTTLGGKLVRQMRTAHRRAAKGPSRWGRRDDVFAPASPGPEPGFGPESGFGPGFGGTAAGTAALFGVALLGFAAVQDDALRSALLAGIPSSSGGSSCGGGGGCGGGGCGGGGCGG